MHADFIIRGADIIDGTGAPRRKGDVAVSDDRIVATGDLTHWTAGREIEAKGRVVAPGFIESPMTDVLNDKQREGILADVPMGRLGQGADVAAAVAYLASEEAGYVTGQTLHVNGGMAMI